MGAASPDVLWVLTPYGNVFVKTPTKLSEVKGIQPKSIAVSKSDVWALDKDGRLYKREGITPDRPEGRSWVLNDLLGWRSFKDVFVGPDGIVLSKVFKISVSLTFLLSFLL